MNIITPAKRFSYDILLQSIPTNEKYLLFCAAGQHDSKTNETGKANGNLSIHKIASQFIVDHASFKCEQINII